MLLARWMNPACTKTTVTSRYDSPAATACLSRPNSVNQKAWMWGVRMEEKPMPIVTASRAHVTMGVGAPLRRARPKARSAAFPLPSSLFSQPRRAASSARSSAGGRGSPRRGGGGFPGGRGARLVVEPVATVGDAEQRGHVDRGVARADEAAVIALSDRELAGPKEGVGAGE